MKVMLYFLKSLTVCSCMLLSLNSFADVSVIVNLNNGSTVNAGELAKIYLGKQKKFSDGASVLAVNLKEGVGVRDDFDSTIVGKSSSQLKSYWSKLVFTGKGTPPKEVSSDAEMIQLISSNPNLIGYVDSASVTDTVRVVHTF